ncbi:MAG: nuclear transport factor 2 family protein [Opitutus sp.]|nr:nuclear transport factor 2 family protein [Opitutus sp.]
MNSRPLRLLALLVSLALTARAADDPLHAAVRAADDERVAATKAGDRSRLAALYSDDLYYAHTSGKVDDKAAHLDSVTAGANTYEKFDYAVRDFRPAGPGLVLMTGRLMIQSSSAKGRQQSDVNFLAVWRQEQGRWRLLAWQASRNPPAATAKR